MPTMKLGELLVTKGLVTREQFFHALDVQRICVEQPIGQILCQLGYIKEKDLQTFLDINNKRQKLGEILLKGNLIDEQMLSEALELSNKEDIPVGKALIRLHVLEEEQLARTLARQHDMEYVSLDQFSFEPELAALFNPNYAQRYKLIPIRMHNEVVTLAMAYPLTREELSFLEHLGNIRIIPAIAKESDILIAQHNLYSLPSLVPEVREKTSQFDISEDVGEPIKSRYTGEIVNQDVDYLAKMIIARGIHEGASDIHLETTEQGMTVRFRKDGVLQKFDLGRDAIAINHNAKQIVLKFKILSELDIAERRRPQDGSFRLKATRGRLSRSVDFRISTVPTHYGENMVIRILDKLRGSLSLDSIRPARARRRHSMRSCNTSTSLNSRHSPSRIRSNIPWKESPRSKSMNK
jgi:type IV pilus assembly protein PilB